MKRIVDGVTYNTATSSRIASRELTYDDPSGRAVRGDQYIMQTRGGACFLAFEGERWSDPADDWHVYGYVEALTRDEARKLLEKGEWEIQDESFAAFPEAAAEPEEAATLYVRMPASLKRRIDTIAKEEGVSANALATRCMERCIGENVVSAAQLRARLADAVRLRGIIRGDVTNEKAEASALANMLAEEIEGASDAMIDVLRGKAVSDAMINALRAKLDR